MLFNENKPCLLRARHGTCRRGDACLYVASHQWDIDVLKQRSICVHFRKGRTCSRGDECLWLHEKLRLPCLNYQYGRCTRGELCVYAHVKQATENPGAQADAGASDEQPWHSRESWRPNARPRPPTPAPSSDISDQDEESSDTETQADSAESDTSTDGASAPCNEEQKERKGPNPEPDKPPRPTAHIVPGTQGIDAYKRGDFREAIAVFDKTLLGNLEHAIRVSLISNRAHAYEKLALRKKDKALFAKALEDCDRIATLVGSSGHFKTTLLRARVLLGDECLDDAIHFSKLAAKLSSAADEKVKAMDLLDRAMAARIQARRRADELERAAAAERKRAAEQQRRVQELLDTFEWMEPHEILGVSQTASSSEIRTAYRKLAMKYHPDRPGGDHKLFQKIEEAFRELL